MRVDLHSRSREEILIIGLTLMTRIISYNLNTMESGEEILRLRETFFRKVRRPLSSLLYSYPDRLEWKERGVVPQSLHSLRQDLGSPVQSTDRLQLFTELTYCHSTTRLLVTVQLVTVQLVLTGQPETDLRTGCSNTRYYFTNNKVRQFINKICYLLVLVSGVIQKELDLTGFTGS